VFHEQFVQQLKASAGSYASIEAANAALLGPLNAGARSSANAIAALFDKRFERFCAINQLAEIAS
jgi:hypothetical protein